MKIYIMVFSLLFFSIIINTSILADDLILKDGTIVNGDILSQTETKTIVKTEYGKLEIENNKIIRIVNDKKRIQNFDLTKLSTTSNLLDKKKNLFFQHFKTNLGLGIGFIIPGALLTMITPPTLLAPMITSGHPIITTLYVTLICSGIAFDIIGIICFVKSAVFHDKWKTMESNILELSFTPAGDACLAFKIKLS